MTGAEPAHVLARKRGSLTDTARNLVYHFLYEDCGYGKRKGGLVELAKAIGRHYATVRTQALKGYAWREMPPVAEMFERLAANWHVSPCHSRESGNPNPGELSENPGEKLATRREAFQLSISEAQSYRNSKRVDADDIAAAVLAMAQAGMQSERSASPAKRARSVTAVPPTDEPEAVQFLRLSPIMRKHAKDMQWEYLAGERVRINAWALTAKLAKDVLNAGVRMLDEAQWKAMQSKPVSGGDGRWRFCLEVAPAALAALLCAVIPLSGIAGQPQANHARVAG